MRKIQKKRHYAIPRNYVKLGAFLQENRVRANLSQKEVADRLGYSSAQFISNFERGIASPPLRHLKVMIELYNMSVEKVMGIVMEEEARIMKEILTAN